MTDRTMTLSQFASRPGLTGDRMAVLADVAVERNRQEQLYPNDQGQPLQSWLNVLVAELGEVGEAILELRGKPPKPGHTGSIAEVRTELLQVAATAVGAVEYIDAGGRW